MSAAGRQPGTDSGPSLSGLSIDVDRDPEQGTLRKWTAVEQTTGKEASGPAWSLAALLLIAILLLESFRDGDDDRSPDEIELGNGDTLEERIDEVDLEEDETCSTDEMRERLDL